MVKSRLALSKPPPVLFSSAKAAPKSQQTSVLGRLKSAASTVSTLYKQISPLLKRASQGKRLPEESVETLARGEQKYESALTGFLGALQAALAVADTLRAKPAEQQSFVKRAMAAAEPATSALSTGCSVMSGLAWIPLVPEPWASRLDKGRDFCKGLERAIEAVKQMF